MPQNDSETQRILKITEKIHKIPRIVREMEKPLRMMKMEKLTHKILRLRLRMTEEIHRILRMEKVKIQDERMEINHEM
jgi:hypothetical protein